MKILKTFLFVLLSCTLIKNTFAAKPVKPPDPEPSAGAAVINLKQADCPQSEIDNNTCFTDVELMLNWVWGTRIPSAANPLLIRVDPGTHVFPDPNAGGSLYCDNGGYVSMQGAGMDSTILTGGGPDAPSGNGNGNGVLTINNCTDLNFSDVTIRTASRGGVGDPATGVTGVTWIGGGKSTWTDVSIEATQYGWIDTGGLHYWYSSLIDTRSKYYQFSYRSGGETWFYGGEIAAFHDVAEVPITALVAVMAEGNNASVNIFGSMVRSIRTAAATGDTTNASLDLAYGQTGLLIHGSGTIHMHGGIVSVRSLNPAINQNVYGVKTKDAGGTIHTPGTAHNVEVMGSGTAARVTQVAGSSIQSPYQWPAGTDRPRRSSGELISVTGQDMYIESDCVPGTSPGSGCHQTDDSLQPTAEPHLMIYSANCDLNNHGPWFDVVTGQCRGYLF